MELDPMHIDLKGRTAIVTGGGGAIGRAACLALSAAGAQVMVVDLDLAAAEETAGLVRSAGGLVEVAVADVSRSSDVAAYVAQARQAWGRIDIFINNAAWQGPVQVLAEYPEDQFDRVMAINVGGVFLGLRHVLPVMIEQRSGAVVNTGSLASYIGTRALGPYTASKHAVLGLTRTAAIEVARKGIRVNAVCPGPVDTPLLRAIEAEQASDGDVDRLRRERAGSIPDGRYALPEEIAQLMVYLCSDQASHITGQGIQINGGSHG
jgi:NAD(P)-dependent dehydrogenase (short-subunit alcohol dehydrogenase family)